MAKAETVDEYIDELGDWRGEVIRYVRRVVQREAPDASLGAFVSQAVRLNAEKGSPA